MYLYQNAGQDYNIETEVHLLYEGEYVTPRLGNLMEETPDM
jgi:hypothetical protein